MPIKSINGEPIVIDSSGLADNSVTREALSDSETELAISLKRAITGMNSLADMTLTFSNGGITTNGFGTDGLTDRVRSVGYTSLGGDGFVLLDIPDTLSCIVFEYKNNKTATAGNQLISKTTRRHDAYVIPVVSTRYYRFMFYTNDGSSITNESDVLLGIAFYRIEQMAPLANLSYYLHSGRTLINDSNYETYALTDLDNAPLNACFTVSSSAMALIQNAPSTHSGVLLTMAGRNQQSGSIQMFADVNQDELWFRTSWGNPNVWGSWRAVEFRSDGVDTSEYTDVSMYTRIGVLGDSYASGALYFGTSDRGSYYEQSWPMNLARQHGLDVVRYSVGGWGTYNFLYNDNDNWRSYGSYKLLQDFNDTSRICGLYVIAFGINDSNPSATWGDKSGGIEYIGSSEDIDTEDYNNNANSYWGNVSKIISMIKEGAPDAIIVTTTLARFGDTRYDPYSAAIKEISTYNEVRCLTLTDDPFFTSDYFTHVSDGHPTAQLYAGMAKAINRLLCKDMVSHWEYYQRYRGINNR